MWQYLVGICVRYVEEALPHLWEEELLFDIDTSHYGFQFSEDCNEEEEGSTTAQQLQLDFNHSMVKIQN